MAKQEDEMPKRLQDELEKTVEGNQEYYVYQRHSDGSVRKLLVIERLPDGPALDEPIVVEVRKEGVKRVSRQSN